MEPEATAAAKPSPWSSARKKVTGPDVKGSPTSHPPTACPQRRPARLAAAMRIGVTTSLSAKLSAAIESFPGRGRRDRHHPAVHDKERRDGGRAHGSGEDSGCEGGGRRAGRAPQRTGGGRAQGRAGLSRVSSAPVDEGSRSLHLL